MTYKEWITKTGAKFNLSADDVDLILCNQADLITNPDETVNVKTAKTALCKEFAQLIPLADIGEGGYSLSWNIEAIKLWYKTACAEVGLTPIDKPKIRAKAVW